MLAKDISAGRWKMTIMKANVHVPCCGLAFISISVPAIILMAACASGFKSDPSVSTHGSSKGTKVAEKQVAPEPFAIKDERLIDRSIPEGIASDVALEQKGGRIFARKYPGVSGTIGLSTDGRPALWGHGSKHMYIGEVKDIGEGYSFKSAEDDPLQFKVDKDKGYTYVKGKGTVTTPNGRVINLP